VKIESWHPITNPLESSSEPELCASSECIRIGLLVKSLNWRTTQLGERVFTRRAKKSTGAMLLSATVINCTGKKRVRILFDDTRSEAWRRYDECFPVSEVCLNIRAGNASARVFLQTSAPGLSPRPGTRNADDDPDTESRGHPS